MDVRREGAAGTVGRRMAHGPGGSSSLLPFGLISSSISRDTGNTGFYVSSLPV